MIISYAQLKTRKRISKKWLIRGQNKMFFFFAGLRKGIRVMLISRLSYNNTSLLQRSIVDICGS